MLPCSKEQEAIAQAQEAITHVQNCEATTESSRGAMEQATKNIADLEKALAEEKALRAQEIGISLSGQKALHDQEMEKALSEMKTQCDMKLNKMGQEMAKLKVNLANQDDLLAQHEEELVNAKQELEAKSKTLLNYSNK